MSRTTLDIHDPILQELRALHQENGRSMGSNASELLAEALSARRTHKETPKLRWRTKEMGARINLDDKEALYALLDQEP